MPANGNTSQDPAKEGAAFRYAGVGFLNAGAGFVDAGAGFVYASAKGQQSLGDLFSLAICHGVVHWAAAICHGNVPWAAAIGHGVVHWAAAICHGNVPWAAAIGHIVVHWAAAISHRDVPWAAAIVQVEMLVADHPFMGLPAGLDEADAVVYGLALEAAQRRRRSIKPVRLP